MSYGTNAPQGLQRWASTTSATDTGQLGNYSILSAYATAIYSGDPVVGIATGGIGIGVAGASILGVFTGCQYPDANGVYQFYPYWAASTATFGAQPAIALVNDDTSTLYNIQAGTSNSGTHLATVGQTDINLGVNFVIAAGSARTGQSATYMDMATAADTTTTLNLKIEKLVPQPNNVFDLLFNNAVVSINNHIKKGGTGTAGV